MKKKYFTEEERKAANRERCKRYREKNPNYYKEHQKARIESAKKYRQNNKEKINEHKKQYYKENKETISEKQKQYRQTPNGRAKILLGAYKHNDKKYNRGECTLTSKWIIDNIFPKPCHWCGEVGWEIMGCDRIDNALPHTPDNVIPCCDACNKKRGAISYEAFKKSLRAEEIVL